MFRLVCGMFQAAFCQCCTVLHRVFFLTYSHPTWHLYLLWTGSIFIPLENSMHFYFIFFSGCQALLRLWSLMHECFFQPFSHLCPGIGFCVFSFWSMQVILNLFWKCFTRLSFIFIALIYRFYYFSLTLNKLSYFFKWLQTIYFTYT